MPPSLLFKKRIHAIKATDSLDAFFKILYFVGAVVFVAVLNFSTNSPLFLPAQAKS